MGDLFLRACRGEPCERTPIWLMRQAGRSLPEYRRVRERTDFVTLCRTPELAAEVTLQPVRRLGVDAAILFSDILVPLEAMGLEVEFTEQGPKLPMPLRTPAPSPKPTRAAAATTTTDKRRVLASGDAGGHAGPVGAARPADAHRTWA